MDFPFQQLGMKCSDSLLRWEARGSRRMGPRAHRGKCFLKVCSEDPRGRRRDPWQLCHGLCNILDFFTFQPSFFEIHSQTYILFVKEQTSDCNSLNSDDLGARNSTFVDSVPFCAFISEHGPFPEAVPWNLQMVFRPGFTILLRIPLTVSHPLFLTSESHQGQGSPVATARKGR